MNNNTTRVQDATSTEVTSLGARGGPARTDDMTHGIISPRKHNWYCGIVTSLAYLSGVVFQDRCRCREGYAPIDLCTAEHHSYVR